MDQEAIGTQFNLFIEFISEEKIHSIDEVMKATTILLQHCPSSRHAVFKFYSMLANEYCYEYCLDNRGQSGNMEIKELLLLQRFVQALNFNQKNAKPNDENPEKSESKSVDDCPQSPSREISEDYEMEDLSLGGVSLQKENDLSVIMSLLDRHMSTIGDVLIFLQENDTDELFTSLISDWALDLASELSQTYARFIILDSSETPKLHHLMDTLGFWIQCPVMEVLIRIVLSNIHKNQAKALIDRLLKYSPHSDWILACLCSNISQSSNLTDYIEQLINCASSTSITFVLSYVSENNPQAIVNCSKPNLALLLKLCTKSKPLLDLLANDIIKKVDIDELNKFADLHTSDEINENIIYCILNAPNAFELLKIAFDLVVHEDTNETLCDRVLKILNLVTMQIHKYVYEATYPSDNTFPIVSLLRNNIQQLISHPSIAKNTALKKLQLRLLNLICICYGNEFITEVFHHLMNVPTYTIGVSNYENPKLNPLISPLFKSLRLHFGFNIQSCITNTLKLHYPKKLIYWAFLLAFIETNNSPIVVGDLISFLSQTSFDRRENIFRKYYILKILVKTFESNPKLYCRQQYKLCISLVNSFFELIHEVEANDGQYLVVIINSIVLCQKLLTNLSANFNLNEYIILQYLLDFIQEKSHIFTQEYTVSNHPHHSINYEYKNLLEENLIKFSHNFKVKKNRLLPYHKANRKRNVIQNKCVPLNKQFLIDLLQSCIKDKVFFAKNFVNFLSSELLLNDMPWLDEDPKDGQIQHLRMTFEKDLYISRLFEEKPILWNVFEIISKGQYLKHCLVIIRALVNVQRANLASSSYRDLNILLTQRIIKLIANNEILPQKPFIYIPELVPKIKNWEMSYVLHDIAKYIRDSTANTQTKLSMKTYLDRLRIIMAQQHPSELYIKIFKCVM